MRVGDHQRSPKSPRAKTAGRPLSAVLQLRAGSSPDPSDSPAILVRRAGAKRGSLLEDTVEQNLISAKLLVVARGPAWTVLYATRKVLLRWIDARMIAIEKRRLMVGPATISSLYHSMEENRLIWDGYDWSRRGEEWTEDVRGNAWCGPGPVEGESHPEADSGESAEGE